MPDGSERGPALERKRGSYGPRLLIILGIAVIALISLRSLLALGLYVVPLITRAARWTGDFWSDGFPIILLAAIVALGAFGVYKLIRIMRK